MLKKVLGFFKLIGQAFSMWWGDYENRNANLILAENGLPPLQQRCEEEIPVITEDDIETLPMFRFPLEAKPLPSWKDSAPIDACNCLMFRCSNYPKTCQHVEAVRKDRRS